MEADARAAGGCGGGGCGGGGGAALFMAMDEVLLSTEAALIKNQR